MLNAGRPTIIDFTSVLVCNLKIPYLHNERFPLYLNTDKKDQYFDFAVSFSQKLDSQDKYDMYHTGDCMWISPPKGTIVGKTISVQIRSPKFMRTAVSFNFTKSTKEERAKDGLDPFRKENVERINVVYNEVYKRVKSRKIAMRSQIDFEERNIVLQVQKPDPEEALKSRQVRALIRTRKTQVARQRNNEFVFEKVKHALLQTYSHDLKLCKEEEAYKLNYKRHLRLALQGFMVHFMMFYRICNVITERVFMKRYSLLQERLKRAKRIIAVRFLKECIGRHMVGKKERVNLEIGLSFKLISSLYNHPCTVEKVKSQLSETFLSDGIVWKTKLRDCFEDMMTKSSC